MPQLEIEAMTLGPFGIGHVAGKAVMVPNAVPGDVLEVRLMSERRDYAMGELQRVLRPGAERRIPPCRFLPRCGGCDWQQLSYRGQLALKARLLAAELGRALGVDLEAEDLVEPAPAEFGYRSRIRLQVGAGGRLGFFELGGKRLVDVDRCLVAEDGLELDSARRLAAALGRRCRELEVVSNRRRLMLIAHLAEPPSQADAALAQGLMENEPALAAVVLRGGGSRLALGNSEITIELEAGLALEVEADVFSQVNQVQNRRLIALAMAMAALAPGLRVLDLFCGAGNFSLPAARRGAEVTGVDSQPLAIAAAARNAERLGFTSARFIDSDAAQAARFLRRAGYRPQVVILDPPRAGARELIGPLTELRPERVLYVSCDAPTLARDLRALTGGGYKVERVRALDFFPNTHHVEVVALAVLT